MLIDIIIPSYNDYRIISAINSVIHCDKTNIVKLIIVDGASSGELVKSIAQTIRQSDVLISERDYGVFDALNKGLSHSSSQYLGWLGSDDKFMSDFTFESLFNIFDQLGGDCVLYGTLFSKSSKINRFHLVPKMNASIYKFGIHIPHFSSFWKRDFIGNHRFQISPVADISFFYDLVVGQNAKVNCVLEYSTIMADGGQSNSCLQRIIRNNILVYAIFRRNNAFPIALIAVFLKLSSKVISALMCKCNFIPHRPNGYL